MSLSAEAGPQISKSRDAMLALVEQVAKVGHWWLDVGAEDLRWSDAIYRIHGVARDGFVLTLKTALDLYHPDDAEKVRCVLNGALATGESFEFDLRVVTPEDEIRHVFCRGVSERDADGRVAALFGTLMDISALKQAEQASRESEQRFRLLAESTSDVITRLDADFHREYVSPACARLFGYTPDEMLGLIPSETIHADDRESVRQAAMLLIEGKAPQNRVTSTYRTLHKDGHWIWIEAGMSLAWEGSKQDKPVIICSLRDVTARKTAEAAIEESEARYRLLADNSADLVILVDLDGVQTYVSPASREVLGAAPEELVGRTVLDRAHPDDRGILRDALVSVAAGQRRIERQYRARHESGGWRTLEVTLKPVMDAAGLRRTGTLLGQRDVTSRVETETRLRQSEASFRALAENTNELIILGRDDGSRAYISPASVRMLGFTPEEMMGLRVKDLVHADDIPRLYETTLALGRGETEVSIAYRARTKAGAYIWAEGIFRRIADARPGEPTIVATFRDISERKAQAEALAAAKALAERESAVAEQASRAKTDFLASMSHEIRTPLNAVLGYTEILIEGEGLDARQRRCVERIQASGSALLTIVNDILDFSAIEAGHVVLDVRPFSLAALVDNALSIIGGLAASKNLSVTSTVSPALPLYLRGDEDRLRQVLLNLLNNAVKFTPKGSVALTVDGSGADGDANVRFVVRDTGIGIPTHKRDALFQRFSQVDGSIRREFGGTGLGLAICKNLVELMGGRIEVAEADGGGTVFSFEVPLRRAEGPDVAPTAPANAADRRGRARILLVEDLDINQELARAVIERAGHRVDVASDGAEAVAAVQAETYDLVLMDVQMPGMDGMTATSLIRGLQSAAARVPIVAMSANVLPDQVARFRAIGMDDHIGKPFKRADLHAIISRWASENPRDDDALDVSVYAEFLDLLGEVAVGRSLASLLQQTDARFGEDMLSARHRDRLAQDAHAMSPAFAMVGFLRFADLLTRLEAACRARDPLDEHLAALRRARPEVTRVARAKLDLLSASEEDAN